MTTQYDPSLLLEENHGSCENYPGARSRRTSAKASLRPRSGWLPPDSLHSMMLSNASASVRRAWRGFAQSPSPKTRSPDLSLRPLVASGLFNRFVNAVVDFQNNMAGMLSNHMVTYTQDYADHSPYLSRYGSKLTRSCLRWNCRLRSGAVEAFRRRTPCEPATSRSLAWRRACRRKGSGSFVGCTSHDPQEISKSAGLVRRDVSKRDGRTSLL